MADAILEGFEVLPRKFWLWWMTERKCSDGAVRRRTILSADGRARCKHIDEFTGRVFLNVNRLEQPDWSLEIGRLSFWRSY